ncbi:hypothetical protein Poli38472_005859 [Pythium oligandrum]|uniref:Uncharacterized protein n=1 Tax=Pythium oligandrum TaxID=41045 RepID=A0A8K1CRB1_PYTOL|nr:hypothetical protein Poli38472_005859 [Pythium oligandrum]|eukprot:TMW68391.1 hypothetical protein Poli38472_005859 [Pythium oligandrum]
MTETTEAMELTATSNPYLDFYNEYCKTSRADLINVFDPAISEKKRKKMYKALDVSVAMKYAWAIPDERALRIIKHFGPIVEMGAGTGYWGRLLQLRGVDIICYDLHVADDDDEEGEPEPEAEEEVADGVEGEDEDEYEDEQEEEEEEHDGENDGEEDSAEEQEEEDDDDGEGEEDDEEEEVEVEQVYWMDVKKGTPKVLREHSDRTLFLCYPDDFEDSSESMALQSLQNYSGEYVIHVGELFGQTVCLPGPWGRTSSSEFQIHLASVYHKVLQVPLPSWHSSIDTLTVWKRTKTSIMDNAFYAFIPAEERLDLVEACPSTRHLLTEASNESNKKEKRVTPASGKDDEANNQSNKRYCSSSFLVQSDGFASCDVVMRSPGKPPLAYAAEYKFGDENVLTATHFEEVRLRNEQRIRNAQSVLKLKELTVQDDSASPSVHNPKRIQQEHDRQDLIEQHNLILLQRLERIHQHRVPKQFDVSHHTEAVLNAPRASNAGTRRREQEKIAMENKKMKRRLNKTKGTFDLKQLAVDADRHRYFSDQISKLTRRRKVQETCKQLSDVAAVKATHSVSPESFYVYKHGVKGASQTKYTQAFDDDDEENEEDDRESEPSKRIGPPSYLLPPVTKQRSKSTTCTPPMLKRTKMVSASDLLGLK